MYLRRLDGTGVPTDHDHLLDAAREPRPTAAPSGSPDPLAGLLRAAAAPPRPGNSPARRRRSPPSGPPGRPA